MDNIVDDDFVKHMGLLALGSRMRRLGEQLQSEVQGLIGPLELPVHSHQYPLLFALDEKGPQEIGQLAKALGVAQPGVTRNVGQLVAQGCVTVTPGATDKRVRTVALTTVGQSTVDIARAKIGPSIEASFDEILGQGSQELLALLDKLERDLETASFSERAVRRQREVEHGTSS